MNDLRTFIDNAREKGLDDTRIKKMLDGGGWTEGQIDAALLGLEIPTAPSQSVDKATAKLTAAGDMSQAEAKPARHGLPALPAALHHVFLWIFTLTSTIMITIVATVLFGASGGSSETLLTYVVMELLTFLPFVFAYAYYLRKRKADEALGTGKVWSVLTIVFHSIGLIGSLIAFVLILVLVHDSDTVAGLLSSGALVLVNLFVVLTYAIANFTHSSSTLKRRYLIAFPALLFLIISSFAVVALAKVGPIKADDQTRQNLVQASEAVKEYVRDNKKLPASLSQISVEPGINYRRVNDVEYELCANFVLEEDSDSFYREEGLRDDYVDTYMFGNESSGKQCWTIENSQLSDAKIEQYPAVDMPVTAPIR